MADACFELVIACETEDVIDLPNDGLENRPIEREHVNSLLRDRE